MKFQCSIRFPGMSPIRNVSYLLPMCYSVLEKCINSKTKHGQGCSTPLNRCNPYWIGFVMVHSDFIALHRMTSADASLT